MSLHLAQAARQDMPVALAGKQYSLPVRTLRELGPLQAWFVRECPSPLTRSLASIAQCERGGVELSTALRSVLLDTALRHERRWPPPPGSRDWLAAVEDLDRIGHLIRWGLGPRHPDLTDDQADAIAREATVEDLALFCRGLFEGKLPDPKSPASTTRETPTPTSPNRAPETTGAP